MDKIALEKHFEIFFSHNKIHKKHKKYSLHFIERTFSKHTKGMLKNTYKNTCDVKCISTSYDITYNYVSVHVQKIHLQKIHSILEPKRLCTSR